MKNALIGLGRLKLAIVLTVISVMSSALITFIIMMILGDGGLFLALLISTVVPAIITPVISWYLLGLLIQISKLEKEQRKLATFDDLTGLLTRHAFYDSCYSLLNLIKRNNAAMIFAYIDIDSFKKINDRFGHDAGDEALKSFASVLKRMVRKSDLVARLGGDEFILALPYTDLDSSILVLSRIKEACENTAVAFNGRSIKFTISIGVSSDVANSDQSLDHFIKESDEALYGAKSTGKNRIVYYQNKYVVNTDAELFPVTMS